jgi:hypothetical protein
MSDKSEIVESHASQLAEHFDSVQIICTNVESGSTMTYATGRGNFYARHGSVTEWAMRENEKVRIELAREKPPEG